MANAPTKTKLHDKVENTVNYFRDLIEDQIQMGNLTKTDAEQLRSSLQKKMGHILDNMHEQIVDDIYTHVSSKASGRAVS